MTPLPNLYFDPPLKKKLPPPKKNVEPKKNAISATIRIAQQFGYRALAQFLFQFQWPARRMGIPSNPLINGLIQRTFKIYFVFVEIFPVIH